MPGWPAAWRTWAPTHRRPRGKGAVCLMACLHGSPSGHLPVEEHGPSGLFRTCPALSLPPRPRRLHFCSTSCPRLRNSFPPHLTSQPRARGQRSLHL